MAVMVVCLLFGLGALMFLMWFKRGRHDRKTALAAYATMLAAELVMLVAFVASMGPMLSERLSHLIGML